MSFEAAAVLADLKAQRIAVVADGDRLRYRPANRVYPSLKRRMQEHKAELLAVLAGGRPVAGREPAVTPDDLPAAMRATDDRLLK